MRAAIELLITHTEGEGILCKDIFRIAKELDISKSTLQSAKRIVGVKQKKISATDWIWIMSGEYTISDEIKSLPLGLPILYINSQEIEMVAAGTSKHLSEQQFHVSALRRIFLVCGPSSNFRGKFDAFSVRIPHELENNMLAGDAFVFCNYLKNQISILQWHGDGFAQYFKRSDYGEFLWPKKKDVGAIEITSEDLKMLMEYPRLKLRLSGHFLS